MPPRLWRRRFAGVAAVGAASALILSQASTPHGSQAAAATVNLAVDPSGLAVPAAPTGYKTLYAADFTSNLNQSRWGTFSGTFGGGAGPACKSNAWSASGLLILRATKVNGSWCGAGVTGKMTVSKYGEYLVRGKLDPGFGIKGVALLWPLTGWPPEVDFAETPADDTDRSYTTMTNHYGTTNSMQHANATGNFAAWHTWGIIWTPTALTYTVDGKVTATMTGHVPAQPMELDLQVEQGTPAWHDTPNATTPKKVDLDVDWIAVYTPK